MSSNNSSHAPLSFDHSLLIPEEPSLDFQSLARTLNFNLPLKLDKLNYVNWKAQVISSLSASTLLAIIYCKSWHPWTVLPQVPLHLIQIYMPTPLLSIPFQLLINMLLMIMFFIP
ncbi:hypothetical protein ACOSQ2_019771 [Xanthoceras sorbifolium]